MPAQIWFIFPSCHFPVLYYFYRSYVPILRRHFRCHETYSLLSPHNLAKLLVLTLKHSMESDFPSDEADSNQYTIQMRTGSWTSATFPFSSLNTMTREFLWGSLGILQAPLALWPSSKHRDLPVWSISGPSVPRLGEFSSTWGRDRRLEVIKSLLNYLRQDWLACLPPWLSSWASKQLRKQPFSKSWTRRKIPGMKDFCRRHLAQLEERFV